MFRELLFWILISAIFLENEVFDCWHFFFLIWIVEFSVCYIQLSTTINKYVCG